MKHDGQREYMRQKWADPEWRAKMAEARLKVVRAKKDALIELARSGAARPVRNAKGKDFKQFTYKQLANALANYTHRSCEAFDFEFWLTIVRTRPDWAPRPYGKKRTKERKTLLLKMAMEGRDRPKPTDEVLEGGFVSRDLRHSLWCYTSEEGRPGFDPEFALSIAKYRPEWVLWERGMDY